MNIAIVSGSNRPSRVSHRIALNLYKTFQTQSLHNIDLLDVREANFGVLEHVFNDLKNPTDQQIRFKERLYQAHALIFVSPEYNGGYSPALKNALDHFGKDAYARKAIGIVTGSTGTMGGMRASQQMQQLACSLFGIPSPTMLIVPQMDKKFDEEGVLLDESFKPAIERFVNDYIWLAERLKG